MKGLRSRVNASFVHLCISAITLFAIVGVVRWRWYPGFTFELNKAWDGSQIVFFVDLVLGPFLTFLVFNRAKKLLWMDLSLIVAMQIVALTYGVHVLYSCRPLAIVFYGGSYYSVSADVFENYDRTYVDSASDGSRALCGMPCYAVAMDEVALSSVVKEGVSVRVRQELYLDYASEWHLKASDFLTLSPKIGKELGERLEHAAKKLFGEEGFTVENASFFPVNGRHSIGYVAVRKQDGFIFGYLNLEHLYAQR